jgi:hypothetical protein
MTQPPRIDAGTTRLFTVQYSASPVVAPLFSVTIGSAAAVVTSVTATSATTAYAFQRTYTMPVGSNGVYAYQWTAGFSASVGSLADITTGLFQVIQRGPWTTTG